MTIAPQIADMVFETTNSTGTGNLTLVNATGYRVFSTVFSTGSTNTFFYAIRHTTTLEWETGIGYMSAATTLVRDTVLNSSNSDNAVDFSAGTKQVVCDVPAPRHRDLRWARVSLTSDESLADNVAELLAWDQADVDTDSFWSGGAATRLSVPTGVEIVQLHANLRYTSNSEGDRTISILKNGAVFAGMPVDKKVAHNATQLNIATGPIVVVGGTDYFELNVVADWTTGTVDVIGDEQTWMSITVLEPRY